MALTPFSTSTPVLLKSALECDLDQPTINAIKAAIAGKSGRVRVDCPACEGNQDKTLEVRTEDGFCYCFRCKLTGYLDGKPADNRQGGRDSGDQGSPNKAAEKAAWIWETALDAPVNHSYLEKKGVDPHGLRLYKGSLIIPLTEPDSDQVKTLQFVDPDGQKRLMKGGKKKGAAYLVGQIPDDPAAPVCICEGFATAASIYQATGYPAYMAIDAGNLAAVGKALRERSPDRKIIFCADNDRDKPKDKPGHDEGFFRACKAARAVDGLVSVPETAGQDFNDLYLSGGPDPVRAAVDNATKPSKEKKGSGGSLPPGDGISGSGRDDSRPEIRLKAGRSHEAVDAIESHLVKIKEPFFSLGGDHLVRPIPSGGGKKYGVERPAGCIVWAPVTVNYLMDLLSRRFVFTKYDGRRESWIPTDCPKKIAESVLARTGLWRFPVVTGLAHAPLLRWDGTILQTSGFDTKAGIYMSLNSKFARIPENPDRTAAEQALVRLRQALATFPFDSEISEAVALSAMLSAVMRPAIDLAPLFMVTAPVAGAGKGMLVDGFSVLGTGHSIPVSSGDEKPEELQAAIESLLLEGAPMLSLDNLERPLRSARLCQLLAQETLSIRIKGYSRTVKVSPSCLVFATGNNAAIAGDLNRRTVVITIDPGMERPELRQFEMKFPDFVRQNRGDLVADCASICRAYHLAGQPDLDIPPTGSFEMWSTWCRAPLVWLGMPDPWQSQERVREEDAFLQNLRAVLLSWWEVFGPDPVTVRDVIGYAGDQVAGTVDLYDALHAVCGDKSGLNARRLGKYLSRYRGRILDGLQLTRHSLRQKVVKWAVIKAGGGKSQTGSHNEGTGNNPADNNNPPPAAPAPQSPRPSALYDGKSDEVDL